MTPDPGPQLEHPSVAELPPGATLLEEMAASDLTDQQKLAAVLQGAALLAHAGLARVAFGEPGDPWRAAGWGRGGRLYVGPGRPGRFAAPVQQLLATLLQRLFHTGGQVAGRGVARRAARRLLAAWSQELVPLAADRALVQIFEAAPFLWQAPWAAARQALAAGLRRPADPRLYLLIAGPGGARRRLLAAAPTLESARALLASDAARDLFEGADDASDPLAFAAAGQPRRAAAAWRRRPPADDAAKLRYAGLLLDLGRGHSAAETLEGLATPAARLLRARALLDAGDRHAAEKALQFDTALFPPLALVKLELEIKILAGRGEHDLIRRRLAPFLAAAAERPERDPLRTETWLVAAAAAWDCGDRQATGFYLEAARHAAEDPALAWRYHQLVALAAQEVGDGLRATRAAEAALAGRRRLPRSRAGRLWNDLAVARAMAGDLAGAERAARHAWRLLEDGEGAAPLALALSNLAEVLLRRGRFAGVEATLERSLAHNRLAGNTRSLMRDLETVTRLELGMGRPAAALARVAEALAHPEAAAARHDVFELYAAYAHGWLGRPAAAASHLDQGGMAALGELEPEERPALLALAGRPAEALEEAHGTPWKALWQALAAGGHPPLEAWQPLTRIEPYRAARLVAIAERLLPGVAPREELRRALATLRHAGAEAMAALVDRGADALAVALRAYAAAPAGDLEAIAELFTRAGYESATVTFQPAGGPPMILLGEAWTGQQAPAEDGAGLLRPSPRRRPGPSPQSPSPTPDRDWVPTSPARSAGMTTEPFRPDAQLAPFEKGSRRGEAPPNSESPPFPVRGRGGQGGEGLVSAVAGGVLRLAGVEPDPTLSALFALVRRDLEPALEKLAGEPPKMATEEAGEMPYAADGIIGRDPALVAAVRRLDALAGAEVSVLILGESGSGKELFARRLHRKSRRAAGPFLAVNCAALSESLILSDLFGHVRGAFTGADRDRAGIFEAARGGTVFLDEIGDLPLSCQGHLLRVLQESEIRRVGESFARKVDVRVVTATHRDLEQEVAAGRFRLDLFFRLKAAAIVLPPLRRRPQDVALLARYFLGRLPPPKKNLILAADARAALAAYDWPGNIRELKNVVEVAAALTEGGDGGEIRAAALELPVAAEMAAAAENPDGLDYHQQIEAFRRRLVNDALAASGGQRSEAARRLGLSRQALSYLIRQLGLL